MGFKMFLGVVEASVGLYNFYLGKKKKSGFFYYAGIIFLLFGAERILDLIL